MRRILATLGSLAVGAAGAAAADVVPPRADAAALVQQLAAPQFAAREQAARGLLKLGPVALPAVQEAIATTPDPALRERAEAILPRLQLRAESDRLLAAKAVTLDYKNAPLSAVVDDLRKKTGINLLPVGVAAPTRPVTLVGGDVPPWQAVELLCAAAGLREDHRLDLPLPAGAEGEGRGIATFGRGRRVYYYGEAPAPVFTPGSAPIVLVDGKAEALPGTRATAVRVLAVQGQFEGNRVVRGSGTVVLNLDVAPLPSLNWSASPAVRVTRAEDEDGRPLFANQKADPLPVRDNPYEWGGLGGRMWLADSAYPVLTDAAVRGNNARLTPVTLRTDDRAVRLLRRFEGVIVGEVNQPNQPVITIDGIDKFVGKAFDGPHQTKLTITSVAARENGMTVVKVHAEMPQQWLMQQRGGGRAWADDLNIGNVHERLKFADAAGRPCPAPLPASTSYSGSQWVQTYDAELHFRKSDKAGPPTKVSLTGTHVATVEVPFAMENVKLP